MKKEMSVQGVSAMLAIAASIASEEDLFKSMMETMEEIREAKRKGSKSEEENKRGFLKFLLMVYMTKYTYDCPFNLVGKMDELDKLRSMFEIKKS